MRFLQPWKFDVKWFWPAKFPSTKFCPVQRKLRDTIFCSYLKKFNVNQSEYSIFHGMSWKSSVKNRWLIFSCKSGQESFICYCSLRLVVQWKPVSIATSSKTFKVSTTVESVQGNSFFVSAPLLPITPP